VAGAATRAGAPRPVLGAVGRQLADNAIVILLTGIVVAVMSFGFEGLGTRIDDTNARIDELSKSLGTRIDDTNARIDDTAKSINTRIDELSKSLNTRIDDTNARIDELSRAVADNGQRLARIEGFLGIGMPEEAAARAPGAALGGEPDPAPEESAQSGGQPGG